MPAILFIPGLLVFLALFRQSAQKAFRDIYLPVLLLFPIYFTCKLPSLPPFDATQAALVPLALGILLTTFRSWRFSLADACLILYVFTTSYPDYRAGAKVDAQLDLFASLTSAVVPYLAGRYLIEKNHGRIPTVKRIVFLLFVVCVVSVYEYRMGRNPFSVLLTPLFPGQEGIWVTQIRWGFGRVAGPYGQSELAGMVFFFGLILNLWMNHYQMWEPRFAYWHKAPISKAKVIAWTLAITLFMTQARGPWLGCLLALPIAFIGRSARVRRSALLTVAGCALAIASFFTFIHVYVSGTAKTPEQQTAQYRAQMIDNYIPIVEKGGVFGWGQKFPRVEGQVSVDNEYLLTSITQGYLGLGAFVLFALTTVVSLIRTCMLSPSKQDQYFAFSLLGIFVGMLFTVTTVYLGSQSFQLFFLLAGWAQSLPRAEREQHYLIFDRVYT